MSHTHSHIGQDFARSTPIDTRDMASRTLSVRAETVNEQARTIEAVISTEQPVEVMDWNRYEPIREVLVTEGGEMPDQLPLLQDHYRALDAVLGSVRNLRKEGGQWVGTLHFMANDEAAERAWQLARQGHVKDVSVGYRVTEAIDIPPGQTVTIDGRTWENKEAKRTMRVSKRWMGKEVSMVPIGADTLAKMRGDGAGGNTPNNTQNNTARGTAPGGSPSHSPARTGSGENPKETSMNPQLRKYLESLGLRADATDAQAQAFYDALGDTQRKDADEAAKGVNVTERQQLLAGERKRAAAITERVENARRKGIEVTPDEQRGFIDSNLTPEQVGDQLLSRWYAAQTEPVTPAPGMASNGTGKSTEIADEQRALSLALAMRGGVQGDALYKAAGQKAQTRLTLGRQAIDPKTAERLLERADQLSRMSMLDILGRSLKLAKIDAPEERNELIQRAMTNATTTFIFTDSVNAMMVSTYPYLGDTTSGWVEEVDVADFKEQKAIGLQNQSGTPKKLPRGGEIKHTDFADQQEVYSVARYAEQATIDEQDIIDDSMGALAEIPTLLAEKFARLKPGLVYGKLNANPSLRDGVAVFHSTRNNLGTTGTALSEATLEAGITAMTVQRENGVLLGLTPQVLIVPGALRFVAERLVRSAERNSATTAAIGNYNALLNMVRVVADDRIGVGGVVDPDTGLATAGTATNWYLAAQPRRTIRVAYLRGSNRLPSVRSYVMDKTSYGIGFDMKMDIGAKIIGALGLYKATGQA